MGSTYENHEGNQKVWKNNLSPDGQNPAALSSVNGSNQLISRRHRVEEHSDEMRYDSTGMFHWCKPRRISEAELTKEQCAQLNLQVETANINVSINNLSY